MESKEVNIKLNAQQRADQIRFFQSELDTIENEGIISLDKQQHEAIKNYHKKLLTEFSLNFDIDTSKKEKQLSLGMKIASFVAAIGLAASIFFLFYHYWGAFSASNQAVVLISTPFILLGITLYLSKREKTGYYSKIAALLSLSAFVLNISMLGQIFNITPSPNAFLVWAIFAVLLAYAIDARLLLGMGIISFSLFLSAKFSVWSGSYWISFGERPENFLPVAFVLFFISFLPHTRSSGFESIYRIFAMLLLFLPILVLSNWGYASYFDLDIDTIEIIYQTLGFTLSAITIYIGVKNNLNEVTNTGNIFFVIFLYTKFFDWWWESMPKYLFFFIIGLSAVLILTVLKRFRIKITQKIRGEL